MIHGFPELVIGGVLIAPFVSYALVALAVFFLLRPALSLVNVEAAFSNPPLALLCIYITILAILIVLF
jgi:Protein of unknown function (DUF1656)